MRKLFISTGILVMLFAIGIFNVSFAATQLAVPLRDDLTTIAPEKFINATTTQVGSSAGDISPVDSSSGSISTIKPKPTTHTVASLPKASWNMNIPWESVALGVSIFSGLAAITGFSLSARKKRRAISKYMEEIDKTFSEYKWKAKRCEAELYRLRDLLEERLKKGKIDESLFELLTKRIDNYLKEIQNLQQGG